MVFKLILALVAVIVMTAPPLAAQAADEKSKGLTISPVRQEKAVDAGRTLQGSLQLRNLSDKPMKVTISTNQFAVADYSYNYSFRDVEYDWIRFTNNEFEIQPGKSERASYTVTVPANAASGGYYFALPASTIVKDGGITKKLQAASLLYLTVNGGNAVRSGEILNEKVPGFTMDTSIPYMFDVKNTGNVHYTGHFGGQLEGLFWDKQTAAKDQIVLPGTVRTVEGSVASPMLPGVYRLTYGYTINGSKETVTKSNYVVYIPLWSIVAVLLLLLIFVWLLQKRSKRVKKNQV